MTTRLLNILPSLHIPARKFQKTFCPNGQEIIKEDTMCTVLGWCLGKNGGGRALCRKQAWPWKNFFLKKLDSTEFRQNMMQKIGMTYEGTLCQAAVNNRGIIDIPTYSILREEFCSKKE